MELGVRIHVDPRPDYAEAGGLLEAPQDGIEKEGRLIDCSYFAFGKSLGA